MSLVERAAAKKKMNNVIRGPRNLLFKNLPKFKAIYIYMTVEFEIFELRRLKGKHEPTNTKLHN